MRCNVGQRTILLNSRTDQDTTERKETDPTLSRPLVKVVCTVLTKAIKPSVVTRL